MKVWDSNTPLPNGRTFFLEASAGTGKTWQMASLVTRLVAEEALGIHEILVITFTNAAAAELRDRVRRRLVEARDVLDGEQLPEDPVLRHLWESNERDQRRARIVTALSDFDRAPISTIHGFCQRSLDQLAFESGQEPGLELLADPSALVDEFVHDALSSLYARTENEAQVEALTSMGLDRTGIAALARSMTQAVTPTLVPAPHDDKPVDAALHFIGTEWPGKVAGFEAWLDSPEGRESLNRLLEDLDKESKDKSRKLRRTTLRADRTRAAVDGLRRWLEEGATAARRTRDGQPLKEAFFDPEKFDKSWQAKTSDEERDNFPGRALFVHAQAFFADQDEGVGRLRATFARQARGHLDREIQRRGLLTFDSMLSRLADRIHAEEELTERPLTEAIRARYKAALIDEFQDTDSAQWSVLQRVFAHPERRLVVVGDPKQAIYSFRGADVYVYLDAARSTGDERRTMDRNWRSDASYVEAMNALWPEDRSGFGRDDLSYVKVQAQKSQRMRNFAAPEPGRPRRPLELRWLNDRAAGGKGLAFSKKEEAEELAAADCAREAYTLLTGGKPEVQEDKEHWRTLHPGDIAVLVRTNRQAERMRRALSAWNIPSVTGGRGSVFDSDAANWIAAFLDTLADPGRDGPARALATTPLFGWSAVRLARALAEAEENSDWADWNATIASWAVLWPTQGFFRVWEKALDQESCLPGLLTSEDGERHATDLRHVVELCHAEERRTRLAPRSLATWLRDQSTQSDTQGNDEQGLRLESDARAVQIVTVHRSKGLEYPVVLLPFAWITSSTRPNSKPLRYHGGGAGDAGLMLDVHATKSPGRETARARSEAESAEEEARLLYVALTRAAHHAVAWLCPVTRSNPETTDNVKAASASTLGRLALRKNGDGAYEKLSALADSSAGSIGVSAATRRCEPTRYEASASTAPAPRAQSWPTDLSGLGSAWQVASFSSMVTGRTLDDEEPQRADEERWREQTAAALDEESPVLLEAKAKLAEPSKSDASAALDSGAPLSEGFPGGTEVGTWVHAVFEHIDFATGAPKDGSSLEELVRTEALNAGVRNDEQRGLLEKALPRMLSTPLHGGATALPEGFRLCDVHPKDRLDELAFQLRLGDGNRYVRGNGGGKVDPERVREALELRKDSWSGEAWLRSVLNAEKIFPAISGILTGFIDLVFRVPETGRYYVADYKTNKIVSSRDRNDSRRLHYTQPWLAWAMAHSGYHLQGLLYTVALHRMLASRMADYDYDRHVGGHLYLFLRGMQGENADFDEGLALGVYADRWPREIVTRLDEALGCCEDGGRR